MYILSVPILYKETTNILLEKQNGMMTTNINMSLCHLILKRFLNKKSSFVVEADKPLVG